MITIGIPKGYLLKESLKFFSKFGVEVDDIPDRKLIFFDRTKKYRFMILRPTDVPVYVENGVVDMGVTGMDIIRERKPNIIKLKDLGFGYCRFVIATDKDNNFDGFKNGMKVATKFVNCTKEFFNDRGIKVDIIKLYGSVELAAITGLSDVIVDLVATGDTLRENNLKEIETIFESTAYLVTNNVFYSLNTDRIKQFIL
ncbi:MAG: ATP phosphoribosyltransferase [Candidatus Margulisbacteria bacterium GWF2_35_9]|nr:MAG: ATP phosphoribosyltransferase [Candidatus Margulisbacteria bacterium GWF2_35_9]